MLKALGFRVGAPPGAGGAQPGLPERQRRQTSPAVDGAGDQRPRPPAMDGVASGRATVAPRLRRSGRRQPASCPEPDAGGRPMWRRDIARGHSAAEPRRLRRRGPAEEKWEEIWRPRRRGRRAPSSGGSSAPSASAAGRRRDAGRRPRAQGRGRTARARAGGRGQPRRDRNSTRVRSSAARGAAAARIARPRRPAAKAAFDPEFAVCGAELPEGGAGKAQPGLSMRRRMTDDDAAGRRRAAPRSGSTNGSGSRGS